MKKDIKNTYEILNKNQNFWNSYGQLICYKCTEAFFGVITSGAERSYNAQNRKRSVIKSSHQHHSYYELGNKSGDFQKMKGRVK